MELHKAPRSQISCGFAHSIIVSDAGEVWTCGGSRFGVLSNGSEADLVTPSIILYDSTANGLHKGKRVIEVSSGAYHNALLTVNGQVYTWGLAESGRLGLGTVDALEAGVVHPRLCLVGGITVQKVTCGYDYTFCLDDWGHIHSFGMGSNGCLGHGSTHNEFQPRLISTLRDCNIIDMSSGPKHAVRI